ncbi:MAG: helix-turn-helix transcriptional regulator [Eubacterium sp.]|nr:helix-turn-helix transcriptional regulator [Eubacterium sp.]
MYKKFQKLLDERGINAFKVSKDTGIAPSTLSDWKNGKSTPKADKLKILADYFGVDISYFLEEQ